MSQTTNQELHVIFGTGPVGMAIMDKLTESGRRVVLVNRSGAVSQSLPSGVRVVKADATDRERVSAICEGAAVVYHCANPPYHLWPELFPPITQGILEGAARAKARLVVAENLYMYGPNGGKILTEDAPQLPAGHKGRVRAEMAAAVLGAHREGRVKVTIGRAADFYGPRVVQSSAGEAFFRAVMAGKPANVLGNPDMPHTFTYIRDFAKALVQLGQADAAFGKAWHVPNAGPVSTRRFAEMVAAHSGISSGTPVKLRPASKTLLHLLGLFSPQMKELRETFYQFAEPFLVDHSAITRNFGIEATPFEQALRETIEWYRNRSK